MREESKKRESMNGGCIICSTKDRKQLLIKNLHRVAKCSVCELIYVNEQLTPKDLERIYTSQNYFGNQKYPNKRYQRILARRFQNILSYADHLCPQRGSLLDVGCSTGTFLSMAKDRGWNSFGIDLSSKSVEYANNSRHLSVIQGTLNDNPFNDKSFSLVTLLDSIEHMPDPYSALVNAYNLLKDDGFLILRTPNADGLFPKITYFCFARPFGFWEHPEPPKHLFQFSVNTINKLVEKAGFKIFRVISDEIPMTMTARELTSTIVDFIKTTLKKEDLPASLSRKRQENPIAKVSNVTGRGSWLQPSHIFKGAIIGLLQLFSCGFVISIYPIARLFGMGNAMVVIAKKNYR